MAYAPELVISSQKRPFQARHNVLLAFRAADGGDCS